PDVLRMPNMGIRSARRESPVLLGFVEHAPGRRDQDEAAPDENKAENVEGSRMRVRLPAEHHLQKMARVVREPVDIWIAALEPSREEINGKWEPIHFCEQGDEKCAECAERTPIAASSRFEERVCEQDEDDRIDEHEPP